MSSSTQPGGPSCGPGCACRACNVGGPRTLAEPGWTAQDQAAYLRFQALKARCAGGDQAACQQLGQQLTLAGPGGGQKMVDGPNALARTFGDLLAAGTPAGQAYATAAANAAVASLPPTSGMAGWNW